MTGRAPVGELFAVMVGRHRFAWSLSDFCSILVPVHTPQKGKVHASSPINPRSHLAAEPKFGEIRNSGTVYSFTFFVARPVHPEPWG